MLVKQREPLARGGSGAVDAVDLDAVAGGRDVEVPAIGRRQSYMSRWRGWEEEERGRKRSLLPCGANEGGLGVV